MTYLLITFFIVAIIVAILIYRKTTKRYPTMEERVSAIKDKRVSANGLNVWVEKGASITDEEITAIEAGLQKTFTKAMCSGYDKPLQLSAYTVAIMADSMRAPESQIWCYKVPAAQYAGTEWDLGGYVLAAGQNIYVGSNLIGNVIGIPDHHGTDLDQLSLIAEYEAEHVVLYYCDKEKWAATMTHGQGQGHPIIPDCQ